MALHPARPAARLEGENICDFFNIMELTILAGKVIWLGVSGNLITNFMKRIQTIAAYLVVLALVGVSSLKSAEPGSVQGKAIVRSVTGNATYTAPGGSPLPLRADMELVPGTTVSTGPDTVVYLNVNGLMSSVRVEADTTVTLTQMDRIGSDREGDTTTQLDLKVGTLMGQVQKVSANSTYEIKTPHGVAGIRGTQWVITVIQEANGQYVVTFSSVTGLVIVSAVVEGAVQTRNLTDGQSWTPGSGDVHLTPLDLENKYVGIFASWTPVPIPVHPGPVPIRQPFDTGGTPSGQPSSPAQ